MIGAFLNALGILIGGLFGVAMPAPLSARTQNFFKLILGVGTVAVGLRLVATNLTGGFGSAIKQLLLGFLALLLGYWVGKLLRLQKLSNRVGHYAGQLLTNAQMKPPGRAVDGMNAGAILFCAAPLGILGAIVDGLSGFFWLLLIKAVMDGLATVSFVKLFRWPAALAALPVYLLFSLIAQGIHTGVLPWLEAHSLTASIQIVIGLITCVVATVVFEIRKVELNSYLPGIFLAPVLKFFIG